MKNDLNLFLNTIKSNDNLSKKFDNNELLSEIIKAMSILQNNEKNLLELQNDNYHLFDDFIDKYLEMNENQNEEVDDILEKNIQKFSKCEEIKSNMCRIEEKYYNMKMEKEKIENKEKMLQNELIKRDIKKNEETFEKNFKIAESIKKKLAKCLGVKKKLIEDKSEQNELNENEKIIKLKEKYSEYLFSYFKEVIEETKEFNKNENENTLFSRSLIKMMGKDSLPASKREHDIMFPTLNEIENKIEFEQQNIKNFSDQLNLTDQHHKQLIFERKEIEKNLQEMINYNNQIDNNIKNNKSKIKNFRKEMKSSSKNSFENLLNLVKLNLN